VPQIDLSVFADKNMVNLYACMHTITKKSQFYRADTQVKILRWFSFVCKEKIFAHDCPIHICVSVYFLKKSQPKELGATVVSRDQYFVCCIARHILVFECDSN
jgi:hypothetical protein